MLDQTFVATANHLLKQADWAPTRLVPHAGKRARLAVGPFVFNFSVNAEGMLSAVSKDEAPDVTISLSPTRLPGWLAKPDAASQDVKVEGDAEFAAAISFVAANLRWDYEEDLSRVVGDIAAHRIGETVRSLERWRRATAQAVNANIAEYLTEEKGVLPSRLQAERFLQEVDELRDAVERLEKRIARLDAPNRR